MQSATVFILLASVAQAHVTEGLSDKLVDELTSRLLKAMPLGDTDLNEAMMGKPGPGTVAMSTRPLAPAPLVRLGQPYPLSISSSAFRQSPISAATQNSFEGSPELGRRELTGAAVAALAATALEATAADAPAAKPTRKPFAGSLAASRAAMASGNSTCVDSFGNPTTLPIFCGPQKKAELGPRGKL